MDKDVEQPLNPTAAMDEVDFTSGYETQYKNEYRPLKKITVPKPEYIWHRDATCILMVVFLISVFLLGTILLVSIFSGNPWQMLLVTLCYVAVAIAVTYCEIQSKYIL